MMCIITYKPFIYYYLPYVALSYALFPHACTIIASSARSLLEMNACIVYTNVIS